MDTVKQEYDDLTRVKGIGEKRQAWLREAMHVYRLMDLAAISADTLQKQLLEIGQPVSINSVNEWIEQARKLSSREQFVKYKDNSSMLDNNDNPTPLPEKFQNWQPLASFVIEYQERLMEGKKQIRTSVHHVEADSSETWPGVVHEQLHDWMVKQAGIQALVGEVETEKGRAVGSEAIPLKLEIKQLLVYQPPKFDNPAAVGEPKRPFLGNVQAERQCVFAVLYEISDQNGGLSGTSGIIAQLFAHNVTTDALIGVPVKPENKSVPVDKTKHKIEFSQTSLPAGAYRLEILLRENKPFSNISYVKFPVLNIT